MDDSDTEFIMEEEIAEEKNENYSNDGGDFLFPMLTFILYQQKMGKMRPKKH